MGMNEDSRKRIEEAEAANRERFYERMERTRANIREATRDARKHLEQIEQAADKAAHRPGSVTELRPRKEPTAAVELTEDELDGLKYQYESGEMTNAADSAHRKFMQLLALESGPGGKFHGGGDAA